MRRLIAPRALVMYLGIGMAGCAFDGCQGCNQEEEPPEGGPGPTRGEQARDHKAPRPAAASGTMHDPKGRWTVRVTVGGEPSTTPQERSR